MTANETSENAAAPGKTIKIFDRPALLKLIFSNAYAIQYLQLITSILAALPQNPDIVITANGGNKPINPGILAVKLKAVEFNQEDAA